MNEQMTQQTDGRNYRLTWREGEELRDGGCRPSRGEVDSTHLQTRGSGRGGKRGEAYITKDSGFVTFNRTLMTRTRVHGCAAVLAGSFGAV